ncbi:2-C-methyl-D-erythritol 4-phosphatecytidylyltransferase [Striga asiatica]|uniref:2-C-methyl-D-erythritol 4-phosphatecytidylyltransferase n=1 Tax=Striga asiatica TaxID=4170 RepID=A0A5A7PCI9_STRAF|nr:2-C-methyl-D-erythritol 4-phosphatecytidylyltransferase [Striga asiatica]
MLETESCPSRVLSPFREESGDEELSVLPRHTKVVVTGNNRTKSVLVGLQGVVKKAVGLGGWHWLVLKNGVEVKLQRNALSVLEPPTGNEQDFDYDFDDSSSGSDIGEKDLKEHNPFSSGFHFTKISKPRVRYSRPWSPPVSTKSINRTSCREFQLKCRASQSRVNFAKLGSESLRRYLRSFQLAHMNPNPTKEQLVNAIQQHFSLQQQVDEVQVIVEFIRTAKRLQSACPKRTA